MQNYNNNRWIIFNYINGAGGKFLANCFFQFDSIANWYSTKLSKNQRADFYIKKLENISINDSWVMQEPHQPWGIDFFSRTYDRGHEINIQEWNQQIDNRSTPYFKECWSKNLIISDFWHKAERPNFWSNAHWITIEVDDFDLYKTLLFTKIYDYDKINKTVISRIDYPVSKTYSEQYQNQWKWDNIDDLDGFIEKYVSAKPWYRNWKFNSNHNKNNSIKLSELFDVEKLWKFLIKYESVFNDTLDFNIIKSIHTTWVKQTELKSKNVI